jgi:hypothetical protein
LARVASKGLGNASDLSALNSHRVATNEAVIMTRFALLAALSIALQTGTVTAQTATPAAPAPTSQIPAQTPPNTNGIPPCPTFAQQAAALGKKTGSGTEQAAAQPGERSGILPSAGGTGLDPSAAPTVETQGAAVRSPLDCPLVSDHPNSLDPGPKVLPEPSKP